MMRTLLAALALVFMLAGPAAGEDLLSPSAFRDVAIAALRAADPQAQVEASEPLNIDVNYPNDQAQSGYRANLEHAYSMYRSNPAALRDIVNEWVAFVMRPRGATERADGVISVLVARAAMERFAMESAQARARSGMPASPLLWRPFAGDLAE